MYSGNQVSNVIRLLGYRPCQRNASLPRQGNGEYKVDTYTAADRMWKKISSRRRVGVRLGLLLSDPGAERLSLHRYNRGVVPGEEDLLPLAAHLKRLLRLLGGRREHLGELLHSIARRAGALYPLAE